MPRDIVVVVMIAKYGLSKFTVSEKWVLARLPLPPGTKS